jgi:hypothetical protein
MDATKQLIRWAIPGTLLVLFIFCGQGIFRLSQGNLADFLRNVETPIAVVGALAGVPLGFVVSQIYRSTYSPLAFGGSLIGGRFVTRDRGLEAIMLLKPDQLDAFRKLTGTNAPNHAGISPVEVSCIQYLRTHLPWYRRLHPSLFFAGIVLIFHPLELPSHATYRTVLRNKPTKSNKKMAWREFMTERNAYKLQVEENWSAIRLVMVLSSSQKFGIDKEHSVLTDIYHGLGASRTAVFMSAVVLTVVNGSTRIHNMHFGLRSCVSFAFTMFVHGVLYAVLHNQRRRVFQDNNRLLQSGIRLLFEKGKGVFSATQSP